jgi:cyclophilin family peptidyl-prolyl cis-trans isomerase
VKHYSKAPDLTVDLGTKYAVTLHTNQGDVALDLFPAEAPLAVNSFLFLAKEGFYDGGIFHRVIPGFVIQGGDPTGTGRGGPGYSFRDELGTGRRYSRGILAMANAGPNTNGSQFFICLGDLKLPNQYTIFGQVASGMEAVDAIAALPTDAQDRPREDAVIRKVTVAQG